MIRRYCGRVTNGDMQLLPSPIVHWTRQSRLEPALAIGIYSNERKRFSLGNDGQKVALMAKSGVLDNTIDLPLDLT